MYIDGGMIIEIKEHKKVKTNTKVIVVSCNSKFKLYLVQSHQSTNLIYNFGRKYARQNKKQKLNT